MTAKPPPPGKTLRIGVTGTRKAMPPHVEQQVAALLSSVVELTPDLAACHRHVLSPLAEGADRLVARLGMEQAFELVCPLPFPRDAYKQDFHGDASKVEFDNMLAWAKGRVLELDSHRPAEPPVAEPDKTRQLNEDARAYEAVGRLIVRNCDLIIGIWDGLPGGGRGGTAEIIRYAASFGPPVVWIHATQDQPPIWIEEAHDLNHGARPRRPVRDLLPIYLARLLCPPKPEAHSDHSLVKRTAHFCHKWLTAPWYWITRRERPDTLTIFLRERPHRVRWPWTLNNWFMDAMNWCPLAKAPAPPGPEAPPPQRPESPWASRYRPADERANEYAARYRSSYVLTFILATIAVAVAVIEPDMPRDQLLIAVTITEFVALVLILALIIADVVLNWHTKAIEYRLLAELCRKQQSLAPIGWAVPRSAIWATTADTPEVEPDKPYIAPISWVSWLFSAWLRDTPLPCGKLDRVRVEAAKQAALHDLLNDQIDYHERRCVRSYHAGKRLIWLGEGVFIIVLALVALKLFCPLWSNEFLDGQTPATWTKLLDIAVAVFPAVAAAFVGIRAYAELEMLAEQSAVMLRALYHARDQIKDLDTQAPLASQALGNALAGVATLMLEDLEGWARLFRGKALDP